MSSHLKKCRDFLNTKFGFFLLVILLFWIKIYYAYRTYFTLGAKGGVQQFLLLINPVPAALLIFGIALYFNGNLSYWLMIIIDALESIWIFANILYYREFSDFLSVGIIKGSGAAGNNLSKSLSSIMHPSDFLVFLDVLILILLLLFKIIKVDHRKFSKRNAFAMTVVSLVLMFAEFGMSNANRPGLLTRTFDNNYIVKYLGFNEYAAFNAYQTHKESATRTKAKPKDIKKVLKFINQHRTKPNIQYYGKAKGKNVFIIHLESFQQFLINYRVHGRLVTPNIDKFYHNDHTIAFDNFYHQVSQGKTSDAEMMLENSLFGLPQGSAMVTYGTQNTYQAAPAFLDQHGYSTAALHGDVPSFWNRDNTYKSWGYQYFFDSKYYKEKPSYNVGYGLKDKIFFKDASKYIQRLPQPFYAKLITLTNHYPYLLDKQNRSFPATKTGDKTVDPYVQTAHYLDQAFGEFLHYLHKTGLDKNSVVVAYGDHYGISNNHRPAIAQLLHKSNINSYDLAQFQKVPFMINYRGLQGKIDHTYGGEIDVLPTLMHLLGYKDNNTVQFGNDLLSNHRNQIVAFRNGNFVTPKFTVMGSDVYLTKTGKKIKPNAQQEKEIKADRHYVDEELSLSDQVIYGDLLRFYKPKGFKKVNKKDYNYKPSYGLKKLKEANHKKHTSLIDKNHGHSITYDTDAPELK